MNEFIQIKPDLIELCTRWSQELLKVIQFYARSTCYFSNKLLNRPFSRYFRLEFKHKKAVKLLKPL